VSADGSDSIGTFAFSGIREGETYSIELHWREPPQTGCPPARWTSLLGRFSTL
jgi:hypothetical protein